MKSVWRLRLILMIPLVIVVGLGIAFYAALGQDPHHLESVRVGKPLPAFALPDLLQPQQVVHNDDLGQQPYLLNIWATWCPTCKAEHAFLRKLAKQGVRIIGVDYKDDAEQARHWLQRYGNPYQQVIVDRNGQFGLDLGVYGAPETYLISAQGQVLYRHVGDLTAEVWQQQLAHQYQEASHE